MLHFPAAAVVAKVAVRERFRHAVKREHAIALELAAIDAPAPRPLEGVEPTTDETTGFVVSLWHFVPHDPTSEVAEEVCVDALAAFHEALERTTTPLPSFADELRAARAALDDPAPAGSHAADRALLVEVFDSLLPHVSDAAAAEPHRLHGEPHPANRLATPASVVWVDFESCCTGPREGDLAFFSPEAIHGRTGVDPRLLNDLRILNAARFATWQTRLIDRYPDFRELAAQHIAYIRSAWADR